MFMKTVAINTGTSSLHIKHGQSGGEGNVIGHAPFPPTEPVATVTPHEPCDLTHTDTYSTTFTWSQKLKVIIIK